MHHVGTSRLCNRLHRRRGCGGNLVVDRVINQPQFYRLIGKLPVPCSIEEWADWRAKQGRFAHVVKQDHIGPLFVSTVFLGMDHNLFIGEPHLFETMIFDDLEDRYQTRCTTWDQAEAMHQAAVAEAQRRVDAVKDKLELKSQEPDNAKVKE